MYDALCIQNIRGGRYRHTHIFNPSDLFVIDYLFIKYAECLKDGCVCVCVYPYCDAKLRDTLTECR